MAKGGVRPNSGRKSKADELKVCNLAQSAMIEKHGTLEAAFAWLLDSGETALIKFAFEHAFGKPQERLEHTMPEGVNLMFVGSKGCTPLNAEEDN